MCTYDIRKYFATLILVLTFSWAATSANASVDIDYQQEYKTNPVENTVLVHRGPSSGSSVIAIINRGDTVTVWASNGIYKKITFGGGRGYVESSELRSQGYPKKPSTSSSHGFSNTTDYLAVVTASKLRVRSGPGENYRIYDRRLVLDETVKVTHTKNRTLWVRIGYEKSPAYVSGAYLRKNVSIGFRDTTDYLAVVTASKLKIRSGPGENYSIYDRRLLFDETVKVTHTKIGTPWVRIEYRDRLPAYVYGEYLQKKAGLNIGNAPLLAHPSLDPPRWMGDLIPFCMEGTTLSPQCSMRGFTYPFIERSIETVLRTELGSAPSDLYTLSARTCNKILTMGSEACTFSWQVAEMYWKYRLVLASVSAVNRAGFEIIPGGKCLEILLYDIASKGQRPGVFDSIDCVTGIASASTSGVRPAIKAVILGADATVNCAPLVETLANGGSLLSWDSAWNTVGCVLAAYDIASARLEHIQSVRKTIPPKRSTVQLDQDIEEVNTRIEIQEQEIELTQSIDNRITQLEQILTKLDEIELELGQSISD